MAVIYSHIHTCTLAFVPSPAVQGALELNRKLRYDNEHQHCLMEGCRTELQACRQQLVEARVRLEGKGVGLVGEAGEAPGPGRTKTTEHDLKMVSQLVS